MAQLPFEPDQDQVIQFTVSGSSQAKKICSGTPGASVQLRLVNDGSDAVHIRSGDNSSVTAAATDMTVKEGVTEVLTYQIPATGDLYLAVRGSGATGIFEATGGRGF